MKKRNTLKGFTLIEMIIVVAIFGLLMAAALSMIDPVGRVYKNAYNENDTQSISENMRRYIGDQLQYADRLALYTGMALVDGSGSENTIDYQVDAFRKRYWFYADTATITDGGTNVDVPRERKYPYAKFKGNDEVYVLHINNPAMDLSAAGTTIPVSSRLGEVSLTTYKNGVKGATKVWSQNTDYYDDYAFDISVQTVASIGSVDPSDSSKTITENKYIDLSDTGTATKVSPTNLAMGIKMYRKHALKPDYVSADFIDSYTNRTITFKLKNLITSTDALSTEYIEFQDSRIPVEEPDRFWWFDNTKSNANSVSGAAESKDIYFIFTKSTVIENVIK